MGGRAFNDRIYWLAERVLARFALHYPDDPRVPEATLIVARSRYELADLAGALESVRRAQQFPTVSGKPGEAWLLEGEILLQLKRYAEAQATFQALLGKPDSPLTPDALLGLGQAALQQGRPETAVAALRRMLKEWPTHSTAPAATYYLARALADLKHYAEVAALLAIYETTYPESPWLPEALYLRGWSQLNSDQLGATVVTFENLLARAPTHELAPQARLSLGEALFRRGQKAEGRQQLRTLLQAPSPAPELLFDLGLLAQRFDAATEAEQALRQLQTRFPTHPLAFRANLELARVALSRQRYPDALSAATAATASPDPNVRFEARLLSGESLLELKRDSAALKEFKAALDESPADHPLRVRALAGLGLAHERLKQWAEATRIYQQVANSRDETLKKWAAERLKVIRAERSAPVSGKPAIPGSSTKTSEGKPAGRP